jgi:HflK protein
MRRTHIPGEWLWLRDKVAGCSGIVLTMQRFKIGMVSALLLLYLGSGLFSVQPGEAGIKLRFGEIVDAALPAGLHYRLPWPFESHQLIATERIRRLELGFRSDNSRALVEREQAGARLTNGGPANPVPQTIQSRTRSFWLQKEKVADEAFFLTGDGNLLDISFVVHYRVADPVAYAYTLAEPEPLIRSLALAALRAGVGRQHIDAVYTSDRAAIEQQVSAAMQTMLDTYRAGIGLVAVRLLYVHPPDEVHDAFRDVASAQEDKQHIINRAKTFAVEKVNLEQGEAAAKLEDADAFKEEQLLHAEGDSTAFSVQVGEYRKAPGLTKFRLQLEAIETTLPQARKFLRPGAGDLHDFDLWLLEPPAAK